MAATALALALAVVPAYAASTKPAVTTGGVANLTPTSAKLLGTVNPSGAATTYLFQYGLTSLYGAQTVPVAVGGGTSAINVVADIAGLAPATTYHYRLVASNRDGITRGADRTFRTRAQPLGLSLAATPNPVPFGRPTVLAGTLSGTGNANRQVVLQAKPFPYTQAFADVANRQLTNAQGGFSFPLLSLPVNTQFRVLVPTRTEVISPIVSVGVAMRIGTLVSATRVRRNRRVRFFGTVRPARAGTRIAVQKLRGTRWITVGGTTTRGSGATTRYGKTIRVRSGGRYRIFAASADGNYVSSSGRTVRIRTR